jgi:hypothetical protein
MANQEKLQRAMKLTRERSNNTFTPTFKFPDGFVDIRLLPASKQDDPDDWFVPVGQHFGLEDKFGVFCPYECMWAEEDCPVCDAVRELRSDGMDDEAKRLSVRRSYFARVLVRGEEAKGVQVVRLPSTLFTQIGEIMSQQDLFGDILHPGKKGRDIRVTKSGTGLNTKYSSMAMPKTSLALQDIDALKALLANLSPINDLVEVPSKKELEKLVETKLGFTASAMGATADDLLNTDDDDDLNLDFTESTDELGDDIPFGGEDDLDDEEENDDEASEEDEDDEDSDAWMEEDDGDGDMDVAAALRGDGGLTEDLAEHLAENAPKAHKRGKTRVKK